MASSDVQVKWQVQVINDQVLSLVVKWLYLRWPQQPFESEKTTPPVISFSTSQGITSCPRRSNLSQAIVDTKL